jgi:hypothetical protein
VLSSIKKFVSSVVEYYSLDIKHIHVDFDPN